MGKATDSMIFNDTFCKKDSMIFNERKRTCGKLGISTEVADRRADRLVQKFGAPQCRLFFLKCIYHLSEAQIEQAIEAAMRPQIKSKIRYFAVVAKQKLEEAGF